MSGVFGVLLAAGEGSRFGGGKLLAPFRGRPLVEHALLALREAPLEGAVAVVGEGDAEGVRRLCGEHGVRVVENPRWREGQSTSVLAGIGALGPEARAAVVLLGDQPLVGAGAVDRLVRAFEEGAKIPAATYAGRVRNPVLFAREVWPLLEEELAGDEGARRVLRRHPGLVRRVPCDGVGDPADVDTREDLRRLEERAARGERRLPAR